MSAACGYVADIVIFSKEAADLFETNTCVSDSYNKLFISQGQLEAKYT